MMDTIAAISTALGVGAISIIRVSGKESISIVNKIFKGKNLQTVPTHTIHYGHIIEHDKMIDEVLITVMKSPKTFTCEDVVEINCHGGIATTNKVLELLLEQGVRLAEPGEFTKRAFLNGRINLIEAEGIMDLISAKTEKARAVAINQVNGNVTKLIQNLREDLAHILANIAVNIDYPEYDDIKQVTNQDVLSSLQKLIEKLNHILEESKQGTLMKEGIKTVIIGRPNVGKSSILNNLLQEEKAIVTDIAGTTRDIVEGMIHLDGIVLNMIDTAGIRDTEDMIEKIGVEKSKKLMKEAELILFVLNYNEMLTEEDRNILEQLKTKNHIILINKNDLSQKIELEELRNRNVIFISALFGNGFEQLKQKIKELFELDKLEQSDFTYLTNAREIALLKQSLQNLTHAENNIKAGIPIDMVELDLKDAWQTLGKIIGETYEEELLDLLFRQFCIGK